MSGVLVSREPWSICRKLEQHTARLAEIDRLEPEAINHWRHTCSSAFDPAAHRQLMLFVIDAPRQVMDGPHAPGPARDVPSLADIDGAPGILESITRPPVFAPEPLESKHGRQELCGHRFLPLPQSGTVQAANLTLRCNRTVLPGRKRPPRINSFDEHQSKPVRIGDRKRALAKAGFHRVDPNAVLFKPFAPIRQAASRNIEANFNCQPMPLPWRSEM